MVGYPVMDSGVKCSITCASRVGATSARRENVWDK